MKTLRIISLGFIFISLVWLLTGLITGIKNYYFVAFGFSFVGQLFNVIIDLIVNRKPKNIIEADFSKKE